jgi:hypothetical protein
MTLKEAIIALWSREALTEICRGFAAEVDCQSREAMLRHLMRLGGDLGGARAGVFDGSASAGGL